MTYEQIEYEYWGWNWFLFLQMKGLHDSLDSRISSLEKLKEESENSKPVQAIE